MSNEEAERFVTLRTQRIRFLTALNHPRESIGELACFSAALVYVASLHFWRNDIQCRPETIEELAEEMAEMLSKRIPPKNTEVQRDEHPA